MAWKEEPEKVQIGDRTWFSQACFNDKGAYSSVILFDEGMEYVTEFPNIAEMKDYIYHAEAENVNKQLDALRAFRKRRKMRLEALGHLSVEEESCISDKERANNLAVFIRRFNMLKGDLTHPELAEMFELEKGTVYNLSHGLRGGGKKGVGMHTLVRIAEKSGVTIDWLLGRE